jgi:hypothetical protein
MRRSPFLAVMLAATALAVAPEANAKCMRPGFVLAPGTGSVPAKPVLELMVPEGWATEVGARPTLVSRTPAQQVAIVARPDTSAPGLSTYRVEITGAVAGPLDLALVDAAGATLEAWTLEVDPGWKAPPSSSATVKIGHTSSRWTCSHTSTANLSFLGTAWAYRVVAASSRRDLARGATHAFVVPRSMQLFFGRPASGAIPEVNVELGYADCFGETFTWAGAVVANVFALLPDGTEQPVTSAPILIGAP